MYFPNTLSQLDFTNSQLAEDELANRIEQYKDQWVGEVGQFQQAKIYRTRGETHRCRMVHCLPDELKDRFYNKYYNLIGAQGYSKQNCCSCVFDGSRDRKRFDFTKNYRSFKRP